MTHPLLFEIQLALNRAQHVIRNLSLVAQLYDCCSFTGYQRLLELPLRPLVDHVVINDQSRPMLRQAQGKTAAVPVQARVERLPFSDAAFARVLVVDALHHVYAIGEARGGE